MAVPMVIKHGNVIKRYTSWGWGYRYLHKLALNPPEEKVYRVNMYWCSDCIYEIRFIDGIWYQKELMSQAKIDFYNTEYPSLTATNA